MDVITTIRALTADLRNVGALGRAEVEALETERAARIEAMHCDPKFRDLSGRAIETRVDNELRDRQRALADEQRQRVHAARAAFSARVLDATRVATDAQARARHVPMPAPPVPVRSRICASVSTDHAMQIAILTELRAMNAARQSEADRHEFRAWSVDAQADVLAGMIASIQRTREELAPMEAWITDEMNKTSAFTRTSPVLPPIDFDAYDRTREQLADVERRAALLQAELERKRPLPDDATTPAAIAKYTTAEQHRQARVEAIGDLILTPAARQLESETRAALDEMAQAWSMAGLTLAVMVDTGTPIAAA
jgi:hypothetical protein